MHHRVLSARQVSHCATWPMVPTVVGTCKRRRRHRPAASRNARTTLPLPCTAAGSSMSSPCSPSRKCDTHQGDLAVDLRCIPALAVGVLQRGELQQAHAEGVHVHAIIVLLLIQLGGHEFGRACNRDGSCLSRQATSRQQPECSWEEVVACRLADQALLPWCTWAGKQFSASAYRQPAAAVTCMLNVLQAQQEWSSTHTAETA